MTSIYYEIIIDQIFYKHYIMYTMKVPKHSYQKWNNTLYSFKQEVNVSTDDSVHSVTGYRCISMNTPKSQLKLLQTTSLRVQTEYCLVHLSKSIIFINLLLRHLGNRGSQIRASCSYIFHLPSWSKKSFQIQDSYLLVNLQLLWAAINFPTGSVKRLC